MKATLHPTIQQYTGKIGGLTFRRMYGKAYLNEFCEIKFVDKLEPRSETNYYRSRGR